MSMGGGGGVVGGQTAAPDFSGKSNKSARPLCQLSLLLIIKWQVVVAARQ